MKLINVRFFFEYLAALFPCALLRILPHGALRGLAGGGAAVMNCIGSIRNLTRSNVRAALPELSDAEIGRIAKTSLFHLVYNLIEFVWVDGNPERIRRCYRLPDDVTARLEGHVARGERIIFVNPHLGSWEASGVMAPFFAGVDMVAIAKPVRNPYLNRLLNRGRREKVRGLEIIFSHGAIRASIAALRGGRGVGTLIDQNTRVRDGGVFVNLFGLSVASSAAPATLKRYCDAHGIPAVIIYGTSVREADGKVVAHAEYLSRPFAEYADDREVLQELMTTSERYIRNYPEQYLWFYKRFQYIPPEASPELRRRYPKYAKVPPPTFFSKTKKSVSTVSGQ